MANLLKNYYKGKISSYTIRVFNGRNREGELRPPIITNYKCDPNLTERQNYKAAQAMALDFEKKVKYGVVNGTKQSYEEYSEYVLQLKFENKDLKYSTYMRYRELNEKIYEYLGKEKLNNIVPSHINNCLSNIRKEGKKQTYFTAKTCVSQIVNGGELGSGAATVLRDTVNSGETITQNRIHMASGLSQEAAKKILNGVPVIEASANKFATAFGYSTKELFYSRTDMVPMSEKTMLEYYRLIHSVLQYAVNEGAIEFNPASRAMRPKYTRKSIKPIQPQKIKEVNSRIINTTGYPEYFVIMMLLCIYSGARRGEIMALRIDGIDFNNNTISINQNLQYHKSVGIYVDTPKTEKSKRKIKVPQFVTDMLREYLDMRLNIGLYCGEKWSEFDLVFINEYGNPYSPDSFSDWVSRVTQGIDIERIHPHRFRHSAASAMVSNGVDIATVSLVLGHASIEITESFYIDPLDDALDKAVDALEEIYGGKRE